MLTIVVPEAELYDENKNEFINIKKTTLQLEHSLVSVSKWEQKWHKAFLTKKEKTVEETRDYVRCMTLTQNVDPNTYLALTNDNIDQVMAYIDDPMTATWFSDKENGPSNRDVITAELIYYWMIAQNIPMECQKWHLNRLLTLIKVCSIKNSPPKKMSKKEIFSRNRALNNARRNKLKSSG